MTAIASTARVAREWIAVLAIAGALGLSEAAWADSGDVSLDDVTVDVGFLKYTIKHLEATGSSLTVPELRAVLGGLGDNGAADRLAKFDATSISIPNLDMEQSLGQLHQLAHYHDVKLTNIHAGKIGTYSVAGGDITGQMSEGQTIEGQMLAMGGTDLDMPGLARVFSQASPNADEPLKPLYGSAYIDGYAFKSPMLEFSVGKSTMSDIRGRPLAHSLADILAHMPPQPQPGEPLSPEQHKAMMDFASSMFDAYGAFSFGNFDMHDFRIATSGNPALGQPPVAVTIGKIALSNYGNSGIGELRTEGMDLTTPTGKFHLGTYVLNDVRMRQGTTTWAELLKRIPVPPAAGEAPSPEARKAGAEFASAMLDVYGGLSVGRSEISDLAFATIGDAEKGQPPVSASVAHILMTNYANWRIGQESIEGVDVQPPNGKFHLGKFSISGLDISAWLGSVKAMMLAAAADPMATQSAPPKFGIPKLDDLSLTDLAADFAVPSNPQDPAAPMQPMHISLAAFDLKPVVGDDGLPKSLSSMVDHFVTTLPPGLPNAEAFTAAGFQDFDLSSKLDAQWDAQANRLTIGTASLEGVGLGKLTVSASADNVPAEAFVGDQFSRQAAWLGALLKSADIRFENQKLLGLVLGTQAKQTGKSADESKADLITAASVGIPALLGNSPSAKALGDTVAKFLADPKSLHIVANAKDGIGVSDAALPDQIMDKVDLKATANE